MLHGGRALELRLACGLEGAATRRHDELGGRSPVVNAHRPAARCGREIPLRLRLQGVSEERGATDVPSQRAERLQAEVWAHRRPYAPGRRRARACGEDQVGAIRESPLQIEVDRARKWRGKTRGLPQPGA